MKIIRLVLLLAISVSMYAQLTQFNEGFEVFPPAGWQLIDHDGDGKKWEKYERPVDKVLVCCAEMREKEALKEEADHDKP